jgi:hypothetical protein
MCKLRDLIEGMGKGFESEEILYSGHIEIDGIEIDGLDIV